MLSRQEKVAAITDFLHKTKLDPKVTKLTLGTEFSNISAGLLKKTSHKLVQLNKGEVEPDDRDNLLYSKFLGMEDFVNEHVDKDAGKIQSKAKVKMDQKKNLTWLDPGFFTPQLRSIIVSNSLSQNLEGINPLEFFDVSHKVTKLGEGGIPSETAIPNESRNVHDSSFGWVDPLKISEDLKIGVTNYITNGVRKGFDNKLYKLVLNKDKKPEWVDHETLLQSKVEVPNY